MSITNSPRSIRGFLNAQTLMGIAIFMVIGVFLFFVTIGWKTVEGNEVGVRETWSGGVDSNSLSPRTYWYNRWTEKIYTYPTSGQVFVMNSKPSGQDPATGRDADTLEVKSKDNQKVHFDLTVRWRIDPIHVVELHKNYRDQVEEKLLRSEVVRAVTQRATIQEAISLYSGEHQNSLRVEVERDLKNPDGELRGKGVFVDSFVIDKVDFPNKSYVDAIEARQLAIIQKTQAEEQQKANMAMAESDKAKAMSKQYQDLVIAETSRQSEILKQRAISEKAIIEAEANAKNAIITQEAESKKVILAARAEAERNIAISEAQKQAELNRAIGIEAVGKAQAEAQKMQLTAYSVPGSDLYTRIKVAESYAQANANVKFYPANANFTTIASEFEKGLSIMVGSQQK